MNLFAVLLVLVLLVALLAALHRWQGRIEESATERARDEVRDAEERGSAAPIAQHPQIDARACIGCGACVAACPEEGVLALVDGIAKVVHASHCIGHGLCAEACPVGAVTIGLGVLAQSPDLPVLSERLETAVPGVFIAGELGGYSLIKVAIEQGVKALDEVCDDLQADLRVRLTEPSAGRVREGVSSSRATQKAAAEPDEPADVLIVGAGPAGFGAALRAIERRMRYVLIDQEADIGGTVRKYPRRKLTLVQPVRLPLHGVVERREFLKEDLIALWEEVIAKHRIALRGGTQFTGLSREGDLLVAETSTGRIRARRVLLCLGRRGTPRALGVPGEAHEKVLYSLIDAATYERERVLVVGGGDSAAEAAIALAEQESNVVTLSYRRERFFRLKKKNEKRLEKMIAEKRVTALLPSEVKAIDARTVTLQVGAGAAAKSVTLENDYVFVLAGGLPPYPMLRGIGVRFGGETSAGEAAAAPAKAASA